MFFPKSRRFRYLCGLVLIAVLYFFTARFGLAIDAVSGFATLVWPPTGIALVALLLLGKKYWPAIFVGALLTNYTIGASLIVASGIALGNTLEAVVGAILLQRLANLHLSLDRVRDVLLFILLAAVASTVVSATMGVTSLYLAGVVQASSVSNTWLAWWIGDALGDLIVAPFLLVWLSGTYVLPSVRQALEALVLLLLVLAASIGTFGPWLVAGRFVQPYFILPFLIWAPLRFGQRGGTLATFLVSAIAIWFTALDVGPFVGKTPSERLLFLQLFMAFQAFTVLTLAAAGAELRRSEKRYLALIQRMKGGVLQIDDDGVIQFANESITRITGYSSGEIVGRNVGSFVSASQQWNGSTMGDRSSASIFSDTDQIELRKKSGETVWVEVSKAPLQDDTGAAAGSVVIFRDISGRKRAESALVRAEGRFEALFREQEVDVDSKEEIGYSSSALMDDLAHKIDLLTRKMRRTLRSIIGFASLASHELRTPLAIVSSHLEQALASDVGDVDRKDALLEAYDEVLKLNRNVHDLLTISRMQAGKFDLNMQEVNLGKFVQEFCDQMSTLVQARRVSIPLDPKKDACVRLDPIRFRQVLFNLLDNSLKHMPNGGRLRLGIEVAGTSVTLRFADEGEGIPSDKVREIFEFFYQGPGENDRQNGIGLGLSLVRSIVEAHNGEISVDSRIGAGTTIIIKLPLVL